MSVTASREDCTNGVYPPEHGKLIYTDGSLIDKSAGAGIYYEILEIQKAMPLGKHSSIYLAEVMAILSCCQGIENSGLMDEIIFICSDSQAVLKALSSVTFKSALTLECWETVYSLRLCIMVK